MIEALSEQSKLDSLIDWQTTSLQGLVECSVTPGQAQLIVLGMHQVSEQSLTNSRLPGSIPDPRMVLPWRLWQQALFPEQIALLWHYQSMFESTWLQIFNTPFQGSDSITLVARLFDLLGEDSPDTPWHQFNALQFEHRSDYDYIVRTLKQLIDVNYAPAYVYYSEDFTSEKGRKQYLKYLEHAVTLRSGEACRRLYHFYQGISTKKANHFLRTGAILGDNECIIQTGHSLRQRKCDEEALAYYQKARLQGDPQGNLWEAHCLIKGRGCMQDTSLALGLIKQLRYFPRVVTDVFLPQSIDWPIEPGTQLYRQDAVDELLKDLDNFTRDNWQEELAADGFIPFKLTFEKTDNHSVSDFDIVVDTELAAHLFYSRAMEYISRLEYARYHEPDSLDAFDMRVSSLNQFLDDMSSKLPVSDDPELNQVPNYPSHRVDMTITLPNAVGERLMNALNRYDQFGKKLDSQLLTGLIDEDTRTIYNKRARFLFDGLIQSSIISTGDNCGYYSPSPCLQLTRAYLE